MTSVLTTLQRHWVKLTGHYRYTGDLIFITFLEVTFTQGIMHTCSEHNLMSQ